MTRLLPALLLATIVGAAPVRAISPEDARHLLARTGFGARPAAVDALAGLSRREAVERVLESLHAEPVTPLPGWANAPPLPPVLARTASDEERQLLRRSRRAEALELKAWWMREMVHTPSPFTERLTLFWHGHFTSSLRKVRSPQAMLRQNLLLRRHAAGSFAELLREIARDPAMVRYLDSASNRAGAPNENFARELFELFTLGEGRYTEADVKEAARAFTGWGLDPRDGTFRFRPAAHDYGEKTVLGVTGHLDGNDVLEILLRDERTAEHVVGRLWDELVGIEPSPRRRRRLARQLSASDWQLRPLLRAMLLSSEFWSDEARGAQVKSPVDLLVGTVRLLEIPVDDGSRLALASRALGLDLFDPPNVKGWPGGEAWVDGTTLVARRDAMARLLDLARLSGAPGDAGRSRSSRGLRRLADLPRGALERLLLAAPLTREPPPDVVGERLVAFCLEDPAHQVR